MRDILGATFLLCLPALAQAHDYTLGNLTIAHPMAFETAKTAQTAGGFVEITNTGTEDDVLLEVRADFPRVELHESKEKDGVATMSHVESISVPAGQTVALKSGGYHVMFMGLGGNPFEEGERVPATLVFEKAGEIEVEFAVEPRGSGAGSHGGHSGHGG